MFGEKHDLVHEFPEHKDRIHDLKVSNEQFKKLFDEYHDLDHEVLRMEEGIETPSDEVLSEVKKKRLNLKDRLYQMIISEAQS